MSKVRRRIMSPDGPLRGLIALFLILVSTSCSKPATYTYVDVHVLIDRQTVSANQLYKVTSCEFQVLGAEVTESINLRCPENFVKYDVGTFQWTSSAPSGSLQFRVRIFDANLVVIGEATSEPVPVSPGKHLQTEVLVLGVEPPTEVDAGDDGSSPTDSSIEAGPDTLPPSDGMAVDGGADQPVPGDAGSGDGSADTSADAGAADTSGADAPADAATDAVTDAAAPSDTASDSSDAQTD